MKPRGRAPAAFAATGVVVALIVGGLVGGALPAAALDADDLELVVVDEDGVGVAGYEGVVRIGVATVLPFTTGPDGWVVLDAVPEGPYRVEFRYSFANTDDAGERYLETTVESSSRSIAVTLPPLGILSGTITDWDPELGPVTITVVDFEFGPTTGVVFPGITGVSTDGTFAIPGVYRPGTYTLRFETAAPGRLGGYLGNFLEPLAGERVVSATGGDVAGIRMSMPRGELITGTVASGGSPVAADVAVADAQGRLVATTTADGSGAYAALVPPSRSYRVSAAATGHLSQSWEGVSGCACLDYHPVEVGAASGPPVTGVDFELVPDALAIELAAVFGTTGAPATPVPGAILEVYRESGGAWLHVASVEPQTPTTLWTLLGEGGHHRAAFRAGATWLRITWLQAFGWGVGEVTPLEPGCFVDLGTLPARTDPGSPGTTTINAELDPTTPPGDCVLTWAGDAPPAAEPGPGPGAGSGSGSPRGTSHDGTAVAAEATPGPTVAPTRSPAPTPAAPPSPDAAPDAGHPAEAAPDAWWWLWLVLALLVVLAMVLVVVRIARRST